MRRVPEFCVFGLTTEVAFVGGIRSKATLEWRSPPRVAWSRIDGQHFAHHEKEGAPNETVLVFLPLMKLAILRARSIELDRQLDFNFAIRKVAER